MSEEFSIAQVDSAISFVADTGARDRGRTIRYSAVFDAAGLPAPQELHRRDSDSVTRFMAAFHHRCLELGLPPLDSLVVHVDGPRKGFPGHGYFKVNEHPDPHSERAEAEDVIAGSAFWESQRQQCESWGREYRRGRRMLPPMSD